MHGYYESVIKLSDEMQIIQCKQRFISVSVTLSVREGIFVQRSRQDARAIRPRPLPFRVHPFTYTNGRYGIAVRRRSISVSCRTGT